MIIFEINEYISLNKNCVLYFIDTNSVMVLHTRAYRKYVYWTSIETQKNVCYRLSYVVK